MSNVEVNSSAGTFNVSGISTTTSSVAIQQPSINVSIAKASADAHYTHRQDMLSKVWAVEHNMNKYPSVTIVDSGDNVLYAEVEYIDKNNLEIRFVASTSGKAYLN